MGLSATLLFQFRMAEFFGWRRRLLIICLLNHKDLAAFRIGTIYGGPLKRGIQLKSLLATGAKNVDVHRQIPATRIECPPTIDCTAIISPGEHAFFERRMRQATRGPNCASPFAARVCPLPYKPPGPSPRFSRVGGNILIRC